ncbi:hypothetical protein [Burkholderia cenocepacia]|uniref:helix-turn-helix transcriptional regulator n=1 Tax=Burkholderia cenocepacia TaxID=95486 RepID=UPI000F59B2BF|nr:hypothetical protein [Burkholderia cenocepacia]MBR8512344.1 hypothetical protein [Burkholderia cenocepacia]HDR9798314.1 hypothetical protein [Burkholderia cenocepacia]
MTTQNQDRIDEEGAPTSAKVGRESWPPHPGAVLREQINGIALETLCVNLATSPAALSLLLDEKIPLTAGIALRLSRTLPGRSFHEWMKIQNDYDLHTEEFRLKYVASGHHFDLSHLLPADQKNKHGKAKMGKDFRRFITHCLTNQIEESVNSQRKQVGLSPWKDRDFENAFSLGTGNDAHSGRQWRRLKSKSGGSTTEDKIMQIKRFAEKRGWLPSTEFNITEDMVREFLEIQNLNFLDVKKNEICHLIEIFSSTLRECAFQRLVLWGTDVYNLDPDESVLDEYSSEEEIQEFILEQMNKIQRNLEWMTISLRNIR